MKTYDCWLYSLGKSKFILENCITSTSKKYFLHFSNTVDMVTTKELSPLSDIGKSRLCSISHFQRFNQFWQFFRIQFEICISFPSISCIDRSFWINTWRVKNLVVTYDFSVENTQKHWKNEIFSYKKIKNYTFHESSQKNI